MSLIQNISSLAITRERKIALEIMEAGLQAVQPDVVLKKIISKHSDTLAIKDKTFNLSTYKRIFLIGFGKGSATLSQKIETILEGKLTKGFVIDNTLPEKTSSCIEYTQGTHPVPTQTNFDFTKKTIEGIGKFQLSEHDLILVVVCGGGSAMFIQPECVNLEKKIAVTKALLKSGADITQINTVRKHLSKVKGGNLAKLAYPATVATLIFSDVPGNDMSFIASGPTVKDATSKDEAWNLIQKYRIDKQVEITYKDFSETPKEDRYFEHVFNQIVLSNKDALRAMEQKTQALGCRQFLYSDTVQGEARHMGRQLIDQTPEGTILLAGGETTVKVSGQGQGGRNQEVVLGTLPYIDDKTTIISFGSDGWDNIHFAGAIGDMHTVKKTRSFHLDPENFLKENNSLEFFKKIGDGIYTGRLPSNVSDLFIVIKT